MRYLENLVFEYAYIKLQLCNIKRTSVVCAHSCYSFRAILTTLHSIAMQGENGLHTYMYTCIYVYVYMYVNICSFPRIYFWGSRAMTTSRSFAFCNLVDAITPFYTQTYTYIIYVQTRQTLVCLLLKTY